MRILASTAIASLAVLIAACGRGSDDAAPTPTPTPTPAPTPSAPPPGPIVLSAQLAFSSLTFTIPCEPPQSSGHDNGAIAG
jgi:hypothetical protein